MVLKIKLQCMLCQYSESNGAGFGYIRFDTKKNEVTFECWPRNTDVTDREAKQFKDGL